MDYTALYLVYQSVCPFVLISYPRPLSRNKCPPPPRDHMGEGDNNRLRVRRREELIRTTGEKAWHSVYSVTSPKAFYVLHCFLKKYRYVTYLEKKSLSS
jgi:hypothetical protein